MEGVDWIYNRPSATRWRIKFCLVLLCAEAEPGWKGVDTLLTKRAGTVYSAVYNNAPMMSGESSPYSIETSLTWPPVSSTNWINNTSTFPPPPQKKRGSKVDWIFFIRNYWK